MSQPPALRIPVPTVIAFILVLILALSLRSYLQLELRALGYVAGHARDLSYLMVSPALVLMLLPIFRDHRDFILQRLRRSQLTVRLILSAVALGVLMRLIWWSQLIARISFGLARNHDPDAVVGPAFSFACPPPQVIGLGFLVMALLVPVIDAHPVGDHFHSVSPADELCVRLCNGHCIRPAVLEHAQLVGLDNHARNLQRADTTRLALLARCLESSRRRATIPDPWICCARCLAHSLSLCDLAAYSQECRGDFAAPASLVSRVRSRHVR